MEGDNPNRQELVDQALERAAVYADAGAGGLFRSRPQRSADDNGRLPSDATAGECDAFAGDGR